MDTCLHLLAGNGSRQTLNIWTHVYIWWRVTDVDNVFLFLHLMASNGCRQCLFVSISDGEQRI